jgi:hypothetical protein
VVKSDVNVWVIFGFGVEVYEFFVEYAVNDEFDIFEVGELIFAGIFEVMNAGYIVEYGCEVIESFGVIFE